MRTDIVQLHQKIIDTLKLMFVNDTCISISKLANKVSCDQRTVRRHLAIAEIDGLGYFADNSNKIYCNLQIETTRYTIT